MTDNLIILKRLVDLLADGQSVALMLVVEQDGPVPAGPSAMMLVTGGGDTSGTIGGGAPEYEALALARQCLADGRVRLFRLHLTMEAGLLCGGWMAVLIVPLGPDAGPAGNFFGRAGECLRDGAPVSLRIQCHDEPDSAGASGRPVGASPVRVFKTVDWSLCPAPAPSTQGPAASETFVFTLAPPPRLMVFGAGHIAAALAPMALAAGFRVTVLDDRPERFAAGLFPETVATRVLPSFAGCLAGPDADAATFLLIATYGHRHDRVVLEQALATTAAYIGMVGSRRKRAALSGDLLRAGWTPADLDRVDSPAGLPIGAETPAEIAVSILARMIAVRRDAP
ncbi:MAG: XdhC family protein [Thermodesulfobacteriota bacterium]